MKTNRWISLTLAAALNIGGLLTTTSLGADSVVPAHGWLFQRMAQRLNLTDDQKAQIKTVLRAEKGTLTTLLDQLHTARESLRSAIQASDATETSVRVAAAKVASIEADLAVERMKIFSKIAPILTDEQRQQINELDQRSDAFGDQVITRIGDRLAE